MNPIGQEIEDRRRRLGMSRADLARQLDVTSQTVLNLERNPDYNLGTRLLRRLESALGVEFTLTMTENDPMNDRIKMGNDEFILHIRKHYNCDIANPQLGRRIWEWLRDNADGEKAKGQPPAMWGDGIPAVGPTRLPGSATQFEFRLDALPELFRFLRQLGTGAAAGQ